MTTPPPVSDEQIKQLIPVLHDRYDIRSVEREYIDILLRAIAERDATIKRIQSAAKMGMAAAHVISYHDMQRAAKLNAESKPEVIDSERAANARLTEECEQQRETINALRSEVKQYEKQLAAVTGQLAYWKTRAGERESRIAEIETQLQPFTAALDSEAKEMSELQKYIDAAKRMQRAEARTIGWMTAANVFRDMPYTQIAALMIQVDAARAADQATIGRMRRAIEWCLENGRLRADEGLFYRWCIDRWIAVEVPAEFADLISAKREE